MGKNWKQCGTTKNGHFKTFQTTLLGKVLNHFILLGGKRLEKVPNFPKSPNFLKFDFLFSSLTVLHSHMVTGKGTVGRSLGGPVTSLQR